MVISKMQISLNLTLIELKNWIANSGRAQTAHMPPEQNFVVINEISGQLIMKKDKHVVSKILNQ
jgi:hypothetical protein